MFGDKSPRTQRIAKNAISIVAASALIFIGSVGYAYGSFKFNNVVQKSSTPIGSQMTFYRSEATIQIKDIFTDKDKNVLIARLGDDSGSNLPYKGSDFRIYISSPSTDELKSMPVLFGRMSTDGDLFLIIPNPTSSVYSIFLMNTNYLGVSEITSKADTVDLNQESISNALSSYQYSEKQEESGTYKVANDEMDVVSFRLTLDPAFNNEMYKPKVVNTSLLTKNEDGTQSFEFERFFTKVFKEPAIKSLKNDYEAINKQKRQMTKRLDEFSQRLSENENDATAKSGYTSLKDQLKEVKNEQKKIAQKIADYSILEYDESYFTDLQTKAIVVPSQR